MLAFRKKLSRVKKNREAVICNGSVQKSMELVQVEDLLQLKQFLMGLNRNPLSIFNGNG